jgi:DNA polymerase-3 subunit alpha
MAKELIGDKIFTNAIKILHDRDLYTDVYVKQLQDECDAIDFYQARFPNEYKEIQTFITDNRGKKLEGNKFNSILYWLLDIYSDNPIELDKKPELVTDGEVDLVDIDQDVCRHGRQKVIDYIYNRFDKEKVKQIGVYQLAKTRAIIQDVAGALGVPARETFGMTKSLAASDETEKLTFDELSNDFSKLKEYLDKYPEVKKYAEKIRGMLRNYGTHPAGIIISSENLDENIALNRVAKNISSAWEEGTGTYGLKHMGYVKFDILGLKNVTIIGQALDLINKRHGLDWKLSDIPLDDRKTYETIFHPGNSDTIFQFESATAKGILKDVRPDSVAEIAVVSALLRPGPLKEGMDKEYARRKFTGNYEKWPEPLNEVLEETYGVLTFQEQIMKLAIIAGFTDSESNKFRKVLVKYRDWESMDQRQKKIGAYKEKFIGGLSKYIPESQALDLFEKCAAFAAYGFNQAHSVSYSLISYWGGYFKANYPLEYLKAILDNSEPGTDLMKHVNVLKSMGFGITRPNINASERYSSIMDDHIILGFDSIKSITPTDIDLILANSPYQDFDHFLETSCVKNKAKIESLIFSGCFDFWNEEEITFNKFHKGRLPIKKQNSYEEVKLTFTELKRWEYESISTNIKYLINDTIREMKQILSTSDSKYMNTMLPSEIKQKLGSKKGFYTIGVLGSYIAKRSKSSGKPMGIATLMDDNGSVDFFIWQNKMKVFEEVKAGELLVLSLGRFSDSETMFLNRIIERFGNEAISNSA